MIKTRNRKTTPKDRLRICHLVDMGHTHAMVADVFGITRQRISAIIKEGKDPLYREIWVQQLTLAENPPTVE